MGLNQGKTRRINVRYLINYVVFPDMVPSYLIKAKRNGTPATV
jgi:hypothetical protein